MAEDISQTFLGVRFSCNKCHDHPFERWTQTQYYEFGAFFARVAFKPGQRMGEEIVYTSYNGGGAGHPRLHKVMAPSVPHRTPPHANSPPLRHGAVPNSLTHQRQP